ncbi:MAG: metal-dependent transcriptional regulator [Candidatus Binatia bacterium]
MSARPKEARSESVEDYLKATYKIQQRQQWVSTSALAGRLNLSPASITNMVQRLEKLGYLNYEPYHGVQLTKMGMQKALDIIRHHRLVELFLAEIVGYSWDLVHDEAERLEHAVSESFVEKIDEVLGYPDRCPHGDPIPTEGGQVQDEAFPTLLECTPGETVVIQRVSDTSSEFLRYAADLRLFPGTEVSLLGREPFQGPLHIRVGEKEHYIGRDAAIRLYVRKKLKRKRGARAGK